MDHHPSHPSTNVRWAGGKRTSAKSGSEQAERAREEQEQEPRAKRRSAALPPSRKRTTGLGCHALALEKKRPCQTPATSRARDADCLLDDN